jgi:preprotein translocase subunit SecE
MAVEVADQPAVGLVARIGAFLQGLPLAYRNVVAELRRVTWPDRDQIRQMSVSVIVLSLGIGAVIALIDFILRTVLIRWIPQLFARH